MWRSRRAVTAPGTSANEPPVRRAYAFVAGAPTSYVLACHEGEDHRTGWTFFVVPRWRLDGWGRSSISTSRLRQWEIPSLDSSELPAAVLAASGRPEDADDIVNRDRARRRPPSSRS